MRHTFLILLLWATATLVQASPAPQLSEKGGYETWLTVSKNGRYLAVDHSTTVSVWDVEAKKLIHTMKGFERVSFVGFTPDGKSIVVADYPRWIGYFDLDRGFQKRWTFKAPWNGEGKDPQEAGSYGVQFSPDGRTLMAADFSHGAQAGDHTVRLLSASDGRVLSSYPKWGGRPYRSELAFVDNDTIVRGRDDKLQLYRVGTGKKLAETRLPGKVIAIKGATKRGLVCTYRVPGRSKLMECLYSKTDLDLLEELGEAFHVPARHPEGQLSWSKEPEGLKVMNEKDAVYQGGPDDTLAYWVPGGRFVVETRKDSVSSYLLYDRAGQKLGPVEFGRYFPNAPISISIAGYGGPCAIFDLTRGRKLASLDFASDAEVTEDGSLMAVVMEKGVLLIDLPKTLETGQLVLK